MLSGICAGLGNLNPDYQGVASEASLIVIKLKKYNGNYINLLYLQHLNTQLLKH